MTPQERIAALRARAAGTSNTGTAATEDPVRARIEALRRRKVEQDAEKAEQQRRLAEGVPLYPDAPDSGVKSPAPVESTVDYIERQSREYGEAISNLPQHFNTASARLLGSAAKTLAVPPAAAIDAIRGGTEATDYVGDTLVKPVLDIADAGTLREDATFADKLAAAGAGLAVDMPLYMATGGAAPALTGATKLAPYLAEIAAQTAKGSLIPSLLRGEQTASDVMAQGGSAGEAFTAGLADAGITAASNILPANVASRAASALARVASRSAQGAGTNLVSDVAATEALNPFLPEDMRRDPYDVENAAISTILGAPMGAVLGDRSIPQSVLNAPSVAPAVGGIAGGMEFARQKLDELRGTSVGKPDVTPPKTKTPSVSTGDIDSNIEGSISSVDIASNTVSDIVDQKKDVTLAEGVPSIAQESAPVNNKLSVAEAGSVIDNRLASLREASTANRLDDSTVKMLQKEEEELRLTLQEDEQRKAQGILQTPERPYLSDNTRSLISEKRGELREQLERHRLAVGRGNELRDLETKLSKLGESDNEVVSLAESLARDSVGSLATAAAQVAPTPVTRSEPPATAPATTLPAPVQNAAVAPPVQPQTASEAAPSVAAATPIPAPANTQSAVAPKAPPKPRDFRLQATQEIQAKVASDPAYRKRVTADTNLFNTDVLARAAELKAASEASAAVVAPPVAPAPAEAPVEAPAQPAAVVPAQSPATPSNIDAPATGGTGKVSPLRSAQNGRAIMNMVSQGTAPASSLARRVASDLKTSPTVQAVEVVWATEAEAQTPGHPLYRGTNEDGSLKTADGMYDEKTNKVHLVETVTAEAALHEVAHAATARAMIDVESGVNTDQKAVQALDDLKRATTDLGNVDTSNMPKWVADRIKYAARNPLEAVAILRSNPAIVAALNAGGVKTEVQRTRVVTTEQSLRPWKKFVNALARFVNVTVFPTKTVTEIQTYVEKMLIGDAVIAASKTFEGIDARSSNMRTPESRAARDRLLKDTGTGKTNWTAPKAEATMDAPPIQQDQLVTPREKGATGIANRLIDTAIMGLTPRGRASKVTQLAVEQQTGIEAEYRLETELATYEMEQAFNEATKTLPQRTKELYRANMMKRLSGDQSVELPERTKKAVDALRSMIDTRSMLLIALGAVPAKETKKLLRNIGSWLHNDYQKTRMSPAQFLRKVQDWSAGGRDVIADMLPDLMADMALPDEAGLDTLLAQTKSKQANLKKERDTAKKILRKYAEQWGIGANTKLDGKDGVVERLKALTKADPAKMRATAIDYANRLLDPKRTTLDTNPAGVFSRVTGAIKSRMNIDDSALDQKRTKMPKWLQTLYGKYSDPAAVAIISLGEQGRILAKFRALWDFRETGLREGILKENVAGTDAESMGKQGYELLTNHKQLHYGPLENMWIKSEDKWLMDMSATMEFVGFSKDPARYLAGYMHQNTSGPGAAAATIGMGVVAAVQPVGRAFKISQVLVDHTSAITNMGGSAIFLSGGLTAPGSWGPAAAGARFSSFAGTMAGSNARKDQIAEDVKFLTRMTVLQNASLSADIRSDLIDRVDQEMEQYLPRARRGYIKTGRGLRRVVDFAARINSAGDEFSKMLMWYARMPHLAAIHPDKTEDEIRELAAEEVLQTTANWHREAPLAKALGNTMVVAPFIVFQAGMIRSSYNSLALVAKYSAMAKDGNAAAGKYAAMEFGHFVLRVAGAAALNTALLKGASLLAAAFIAAGGDSDEEKEKALKEWEEGNKLNAPDVYVHARGLLADYQLGDINFMRKTGEDTYTYASTQRLETLPFANIWSASKRNDTDELVEIGLGYMSEVPTWLPFMTALANTPAAITEGFKESGPSQKAAGKGYWETGKAITPGMFKRVYNQIDTPTEFSPVEKIMNNTIFTVQTLDLKKEAGNLAADYTISVGRAMDSLRDDAKKEEAYEKVGINSVLDYTGTVEKKYTAYVKARKKVLALQGMGKDEEWIRAQIKANPINDSLSKPELTSLMQGYFIMPDFDKALTKKEEQQVKAVTTEIDKQRVRDLFKEYREQLNDQKALFQAFIKRDGEVVR